MMKRIIACAVMVGLLLLSLNACKQNKEDLIFYVIAAEDLPAKEAAHVLFDVAKQSGRIAFTGEDIENWHWETHRVALKKPDVRGGSGCTGSSLFQADAEDAFLLVLGNRVLLFGGFENKVGALTIDRDLYVADEQDADAFRLLCRNTEEEGEDPRKVEALYKFLADHNLLASER